MPDNKELNDTELIAKCLRQDAEAWEILVRRYQRLISSITYKFKLSAEDSADVFQAVCIILFQQMSGLKPDAKLSSWLITVTVRECWKLRERNKKTEGMDDDDLDRASEIPDQQHHLIEEDLLNVERQHLIRRSIELLSEQCRELIGQLFYQETPATYAEISRQLGMPVASIGATRARCLEKLKDELKKIGFF